MRKKYALTLLEVAISMVLLTTLLTTLFNLFHQGIKKSFSAKALKLDVLQIESFEQKMKHLLSLEEGVFIDEHPETLGMALFIPFENKIDPDFEMVRFRDHIRNLCLERRSLNDQTNLVRSLQNQNHIAFGVSFCRCGVNKSQLQVRSAK